ncbi:helix-turn-helix domain-containing protein [Actinoplanes hulinensis]|uniref:Helix-turn-helix domain-containing protein n=1 Tax=Actinoplanes hulinensis TaxID=1144547 RepID=A0ABS7BAV9_9ACTN|nr:helix-turn-helix transcriptional regulator [Actinoplanes hulinensis]MBW6438095.1 helix-turn-helix domain-containing protein [Actinoplanes hulinensis]
MNRRRSPTVRRRRLGVELRRYREAAGVTIDVVAERLGCSTSKISRIETGHTTASPPDVSAMLAIYGVDPDISGELVEISRDARKKGWWHPFSTVLNSTYVGFEAEARSIQAYEQQVIPGLLQSEQYAMALIRSARWDDPDQEIAQRVRVRMERQSLLIQDDPIDLWVVLDEAVVSRPVGGDAVMRDQLRHLVEAAGLPNVTLQILPFAVGAHAAMDGAFAILDFPSDGDPALVFAENAAGGLFLEKDDELRKFREVFGTIRAAALDPEASIEMIEKLAEEPLWKSRRRASESI